MSAKQLINKRTKAQTLVFFCLLVYWLASIPQAHAVKIIDNWKLIQDSFYAGQDIPLAQDELNMQAPEQAENASLVPLAIAVTLTDASIHRLDLFVDANPIPLTLSVLPQTLTSQLHLSTRIRLENSSVVRLVVEDSSGAKRMQTIAIKTPGGGCGGGLNTDEAKLRQEAGKMQFRLSSQNKIALYIKHPMRTGFERTTQGYYAKAWFIKYLRLSLDDKAWLHAELGPGISADPYLQLALEAASKQPTSLHVEADDNEGATFKQSFTWSLSPL